MNQDLVDIASAEIGTQEDAKHTNTGSSIAKYQADTALGGTGWPWCAAFVSWCVDKYFKKEGIDIPPPRTASTFHLILWGEQNGLEVFDADTQPPEPGDIVVYTFSHCGIVSQVVDSSIHVIEGNTNTDGSRDGYEVAERSRTYAYVRKFIRI